MHVEGGVTVDWLKKLQFDCHGCSFFEGQLFYLRGTVFEHGTGHPQHAELYRQQQLGELIAGTTGATERKQFNHWKEDLRRTF